MFVCKARGCFSNQNTKVDGRDILFYPFPEEDRKRNQWLRNCKLSSNTANEKQPLYLCELHFAKANFSATGELHPNADPTIFSKVDEYQHKYKGEANVGLPTLKQRKLDENSHSLITPLQSPFTQVQEKMEEASSISNVDVSGEATRAVNGIAAGASTLSKSLGNGKKVYRLTIQIDKIRAKPGPRSKKLRSLMLPRRNALPVSTNGHESDQIELSPLKISKKLPCAQGGCRLKKSTYESKPAYQCEHCDKYYVMTKSENQEEKTNFCTVCYEAFSSPQSLNLHIKKHFLCDMCQTECSSQVTYDKHARLHVSTDPLFPYKCHQCTEIFELKEDVKQHYLIMHPTIQLQNTILKMTTSPIASQVTQQKDYRCVSCNITFRNEQPYRNHMNSHKKKEGLRCNINETNNIIPVPNPLTGSQIGILRAVKFSCRVCSKEFDNVGEVDKHTRTHLEDVEEEHKCNICKKLFKTSGLLNEHLKHHLSRAHPCPICPKAFINRTTLKIHLKTHGDV